MEESKFLYVYILTVKIYRKYLQKRFYPTDTSKSINLMYNMIEKKYPKGNFIGFLFDRYEFEDYPSIIITDTKIDQGETICVCSHSSGRPEINFVKVKETPEVLSVITAEEIFKTHYPNTENKAGVCKRFGPNSLNGIFQNRNTWEVIGYNLLRKYCKKLTYDYF